MSLEELEKRITVLEKEVAELKARPYNLIEKLKSTPLISKETVMSTIRDN